MESQIELPLMQVKPKTYTREEIAYQIGINDAWLIRGIKAIHARQTDEERQNGETMESNGVGFNGVDAPFLSSLAIQHQLKGFLTQRQIVMARPRMFKYCGQLAKIANGTIM